MITYVLTGLALVLVIEGAVYALAPAQMQRLMARVQDMPVGTLRVSGITAAVIGVLIIWLFGIRLG